MCLINRTVLHVSEVAYQPLVYYIHALFFHKIGFSNTSCSITGLDAYWDYTIAVKVFTDGFPPKQYTAVLKTSQSGNCFIDIYTAKIYGLFYIALIRKIVFKKL